MRRTYLHVDGLEEHRRVLPSRTRAEVMDYSALCAEDTRVVLFSRRSAASA